MTGVPRIYDAQPKALDIDVEKLRINQSDRDLDRSECGIGVDGYSVTLGWRASHGIGAAGTLRTAGAPVQLD